MFFLSSPGGGVEDGSQNGGQSSMEAQGLEEFREGFAFWLPGKSCESMGNRRSPPSPYALV